MSAQSCGLGVGLWKGKSAVVFLCGGSDAEIQVKYKLLLPAWKPDEVSTGEAALVPLCGVASSGGGALPRRGDTLWAREEVHSQHPSPACQAREWATLEVDLSA